MRRAGGSHVALLLLLLWPAEVSPLLQLPLPGRSRLPRLQARAWARAVEGGPGAAPPPAGDEEESTPPSPPIDQLQTRQKVEAMRKEDQEANGNGRKNRVRVNAVGEYEETLSMPPWQVCDARARSSPLPLLKSSDHLSPA